MERARLSDLRAQLDVARAEAGQLRERAVAAELRLASDPASEP
ncbi:hypothetical protein OG320_10975 [Microbispora sp. NBC_01189]|nr:hypothetical protein OG320_10975 [Microbispora sp. NBC_01189]